MAEDWRRATLGECFTLVKAKVLPSDLADETLYVGLEHIEPGNPRPGVVGRTVDVAGLVTPFLPGDTLFGRLRPYLRKVAWADRPGVCTPEVLVLRPTPEVLPGYLHLLASAESTISRAVAASAGTRMPRTSSADLTRIEVALPPLAVQGRIVDLIGALDAHLDRLRTEADSLRTLLASVHRRLDEAAEWRQLREFADADGIQIGPFGSQLHASDYVDDGLPVVMPQDMVDGAISDARIKRVKPGQAERLARHVLQEGDILFARRGDLTKRAWVGPEHAGGLCGTGSIRFRPRRATMASALFEALSTERSSCWLLEHAVGTTMPNLNTQIISALPVPDLDEDATGSAAAAAGIRRHLVLLSREAEATSGLRTILLNDLLSGEVEVSETYDRLVDAGVA